MAANSLAPAGEPRLPTDPTTAEVIDQFRAALAARDIVVPLEANTIPSCQPEMAAVSNVDKGPLVCGPLTVPHPRH